MDLKGKTVLVIGGAGFIGSHTVDKLLSEDIEKIIIYDNFTRGSTDNLSAALKDPRVKIYEAISDILYPEILNSASKDCDAIFHFAGLWLLECHEFPTAAFKVNIEGMFNVLEACRHNNIKRLVWSSSASVYGDAIEEPMRESHPLNNKNFYGATKIACESMATAYTHRYGLEQVGLRYMNVYGPRQDYKGAYVAVILKMLDAIENGDGPVIYGDGSESYDFIEVNDCAIANVCAMKANTTATYYNVATNKSISLTQLAEMLLYLTNSRKSIRYEIARNTLIAKNRIGSTDLATKELNFTAEVDFEAGLVRLIDWVRCQRKNEKL